MGRGSDRRRVDNLVSIETRSNLDNSQSSRVVQPDSPLRHQSELGEITRFTGSGGRVEWRLDGSYNGRLHRENGPAILEADGTRWWYQNNQLHRLNGPAVVLADGSQYWYQDNKLHRLEGPAVLKADGTQEYWVEGYLIEREAQAPS